jgi:hypothetical protein
MTLQDFLQNYISFYTSEKNNVIVFKGHEYAPLFFSQLLEKIKKDPNKFLKNVSNIENKHLLLAELSTSFLGINGIYWLGDVSSYNPLDQKKILAFLKSYSGPHQVMLYISEKSELNPEHGCIVEIEKEYAYDSIKSITAVYSEENISGIIYFLRALFQKKQLYALEELSRLLQYQPVLGQNKTAFLDEWFSKLTRDDRSLFYLSELFFAKKNDAFIQEWNNIFHQYSEMFWISFWSEQFFKSYCYIFQQQQQKIVSKFETYGLPFSFLKSDWKKHNLKTLQKNHQKIYEVDALLKNGIHHHLMFSVLIECL